MPSKPLEPGDPVRLGRFELLGRLGEGGQGVVYLGRGTNPGEERVAVKVLRSTVDANVLERLARELDAIHQVQPFVTAGVIEASAEGDRRYVVSEFIDGPSPAWRGTSLAGSASSPAATASQSTSPPPATTGATIPAAFAGTWKGKATMAAVGATSLGLTNNIAFTFVGGERTIHETDQDSYGGACVNTLTLREATATVLTFDEPQTGGCVAGTVTFTHRGDSLAYRWTDNIEQNTATLRKA